MAVRGGGECVAGHQDAEDAVRGAMKNKRAGGFDRAGVGRQRIAVSVLSA
jgi:hypothetical protein